MADPSLDDKFARLERERLDADRRYNDALTAVDRAIQRTAAFPEPPEPDALPAGAGWPTAVAPRPPSFGRSFKGRWRAAVWGLVSPYFDEQVRWNAAAAAAAERQAAGARRLTQALAETIAATRREFEALSGFHSLLVQYLQTITAYVDTKDRSHGGAELRQRVALAEQRMLALKRELEERQTAGGVFGGEGAAGVGDAAAASQEAFGRRADAPTYVGFEDLFRGSAEDIRRRAEEYVPLLAKAADPVRLQADSDQVRLKADTSNGTVVDVGCGRGELLDALRAAGIPARGIDLNHAMVEVCRARGLDVVEADAVSGLRQLQDDSVAGLVAIQVVEHFEPAYLVRFLDVAHQKMRPGAPLILETINPACWMAFFETYIRDLTHQRPLHPDTLKYLVEASGFTGADVHFRRPVREADKLDSVAVDPAIAGGHPGVAAVVAALNAHADKLNARLFSSMDYVIVARR